MNYFNKYPYTKATGISLLLHGIVIVCLGAFGFSTPIVQPLEVTAVEVSLVPARVIDMGDMANLTAVPTDSPPAPAEKPVPRPSEPRAQVLPPVLPGEAGETSSGSLAPAGRDTPAAGSGTADTAVVGQAGSPDEDGGPSTNAGYLAGPKPAYPPAARKAGWEGAVVVRALIATDGSVAAVAVRVGSGYPILDEAAAQAVQKWRFSPARKGGRPVTGFHDVKVRFRLTDA